MAAPFAFAQETVTVSSLTPPVAPQSASLQKMEDVLRYTYENNPSLRAARSELRAVQEQLPQAQAGWKPSANATAGMKAADFEGNLAGEDGTTNTELGIDLTQPLYRGGRTVASTASARNIIMAQRSFLNSTEQTVLMRAAAVYMDVSRDRALVELRQNNYDVIKKQLDASQNRFEVGEATRTDVSQSEARLARAEADRISAVGNLQVSEAAFEAVTGLKPERVGIPVLNFPIPTSEDDILEVADVNNPDIQAATYLHKASEKDVRTIWGELLPNVALSGGLTKDYDPQPGGLDDSRVASIGVVASIPLYEAGATRSRVRQAKETVNQRYLEVLDARRRVRAEAVTHWENLQSARSEIKARTSQAEAARIAMEGVKQEADLGTRTVLDALDADQEYLDAQTALITARRNEVIATFTLAASLGFLTPKTLGFPELETDYDKHLKDIQGKILGMDVESVK